MNENQTAQTTQDRQRAAMTQACAEHDAQDAREAAVRRNIIDSAPTLSSSCMLVELNISVCEMRKKDKRATEQVAVDNNAHRNVATVHKSLMADCEYLKAIKTHRGIVRNHLHYHFTQPWSDCGLRMLTTAAYFHYLPAMQEAEKTFNELVEAFIANYQVEIAKAQVALGDLFDAHEYPEPETLRQKFSFCVTYIPMPEAGDFRLDIAQDTIQHLQTGYEKFYADKFNAAMQDIWARLKEPLANMVEKLDYGEGETKRIFKNTLVDNVLNIVDLMAMVNVNNDPIMAKVEANLRNALEGISPDALREDAHLRSQARRAAQDALRDTQQQIADLPSLL